MNHILYRAVLTLFEFYPNNTVKCPLNVWKFLDMTRNYIIMTSTFKGNLINFVLKVDQNLKMSATCLLLMYVSVP